MAVRNEKALARKAALARRERVSAHLGAEAGAAVAERFLAALKPPQGATVSGYWPFGGELDPRPLMERLYAGGHVLALPVIAGRGLPLIFRRWQPGQALEAGAHGIPVPGPAVAEIVPRLLLVPLLAFDRDGYRLGYGGGYYDRTLARLKAEGEALAVGLAFAAQEVDAVPHEGQDQRLDWIVTEREAIALEGR